ASVNVPVLAATVSGVTFTPATPSEGIGNEAQSFTIAGTTGGTFTVSFAGVAASSAQTFNTGSNPTQAEMLAHLNSIPARNGKLAVLGGTAGPFLIVFNNNLAASNVPLLTTAVTGGTTATPALVSDGIGNELQSVTLGGTSGGTFTMSFGGVFASAPLTFS